MTITKKVIMVLDVVSPVLLVATSIAVAVALNKILTLYDFYRAEPAFPEAEVLIFFGLAFFPPPRFSKHYCARFARFLAVSPQASGYVARNICHEGQIR